MGATDKATAYYSIRYGTFPKSRRRQSLGPVDLKPFTWQSIVTALYGAFFHYSCHVSAEFSIRLRPFLAVIAASRYEHAL